MKFRYILMCTVLAACSAEVSPEQRAAEAALDSYRHLVDGRTDKFLAGMAAADSMPDGYRQQMQQAVERYLRVTAAKHGGLQSVALSHSAAARRDTLPVSAVGNGPQVSGAADVVVYAFLQLCYKDSTSEEILVPMVETPDGQWRMRR